MPRDWPERARKRGLTERPIPQRGDITSLEALAPHAGRAVKFTNDRWGNGSHWLLGVVQPNHHGFYDAGKDNPADRSEYGYVISLEEDAGDNALTCEGFDRENLVVRLATRRDCRGLTFSYGRVPTWPRRRWWPF